MLIRTSKAPGWGKRKPRAWGPLSAVRSAVRRNAEGFYRFDSALLDLCVPLIEGGGVPSDFGPRCHVVGGSGVVWNTDRSVDLYSGGGSLTVSAPAGQCIYDAGKFTVIAGAALPAAYKYNQYFTVYRYNHNMVYLRAITGYYGTSFNLVRDWAASADITANGVLTGFSGNISVIHDGVGNVGLFKGGDLLGWGTEGITSADQFPNKSSYPYSGGTLYLFGSEAAASQLQSAQFIYLIEDRLSSDQIGLFDDVPYGLIERTPAPLIFDLGAVAGVFADGAFLASWNSPAVADRALPFSAPKSLQTDGQVPLSVLDVLAADGQVPLSALEDLAAAGTLAASWARSLAVDADLPASFLKRLAIDGKLPASWAGSVISIAADGVLPLSWVRALAVDGQLPLFALKSLAASGYLAAGWARSLAADADLAASFLKSLAADGMLPASWAGSVLSVSADGILPLSWDKRLAADGALAASYPAGLQVGQELQLSIRKVLQVDARAELSISRQLAVDAVLPLGWTGLVLVGSDGVLPISWGKTVTSDHQLRISSIKQLQIDGNLAAGWLVEVETESSLVLDWLKGVYGEGQLQVSWDGDKYVIVLIDIGQAQTAGVGFGPLQTPGITFGEMIH